MNRPAVPIPYRCDDITHANGSDQGGIPQWELKNDSHAFGALCNSGYARDLEKQQIDSAVT